MQKQNKRYWTKAVVRNVARLCVTAVATSAVSKVRDDDESTTDKVQTAIGGAVIGWMVGDYVAKFTDDKVDEFFDSWNDAETVEEDSPEEK